MGNQLGVNDLLVDVPNGAGGVDVGSVDPLRFFLVLIERSDRTT